MAIVGTCTYDTRNQLVRPSRLETCRARICLDLDVGPAPTFDRDHVHVFAMVSSGITVSQARVRAQSRLARFIARTEDVAGYRKIAASRTQGITPCNRNITITDEILYAVEAPVWARRRTPEFP
ncbi:hypothetical protein ACIQUM_07575 [Amycolatopsis azurea]|uniref:hypothetical protein n=1 Tax=Amycolatopsis azurea TaxID=36819 RepID=UPI0037FA2DAA